MEKLFNLNHSTGGAAGLENKNNSGGTCLSTMLLSLLSRRSLELDSRDSYGFALRPQHIPRYKEYTSIYKEEEEERSVKWNIFLEQIQPGQPDSTEEEHQETTKTESEKSDSVSESDGSTECEPRNDVHHTESSKEDDRLTEQHKEEDGPTEEAQSSHELWEKVKLSKEHLTQLEKVGKLSEERGKEYKLSVENRGNEVLVEPVQERQISEETSQNNVQSAKNPENEQILLEKSIEKEQPSEKVKEAKGKEPVKKPHCWARIRPSLGSIENMMSRRVKDKQTADANHLITSDSTMVITTSNEGNSEPFFPWKEELQFLVQGGLPKDLRGEVWQAFVGVKERRIKRYYQDLLAEEAYDDESESSSRVEKKWKRQIEKDIPRTFPGHPALNENGRDSLRRILFAYAQHNPSVGYCQAMNFFAGILLLLMPEENAFWWVQIVTFLGIIDDYFEGYYSEEMIESQVDQLVFEELMREKFPKLVKHLDDMGVQVAWITGPWFLSIFVNVLPWECVLRVWDVLLFEGNRVMLFRTALALMELYGPPLLNTKDAGDAITLLQSRTGSTFDSSSLVITACMVSVTEPQLQRLREKHRPAVLEIVEERANRGRIWKDSKGIASKLYSFKNDRGKMVDESKNGAPGDQLDPSSSNLDQLLDSLSTEGTDSLDLQEQVVWLKVELCRVLQEKRTATLRAEELETALIDIAKEDNRLELMARIEELEEEVAGLKQALADKKEQESAMLQVLMRVEQEQKVTEDARRSAEREATGQSYAVRVLEEKYDKAMASVAQMEKKLVMAESMLEATLQYESGQAKAVSSPRPQNTPKKMEKSLSGYMESPRRKIPLLTFGLGWRDKNKGKQSTGEESDSTSAQRQSDLQEPQPQGQ
ncbi:hypothetical protein ACFE04_020357 [Oxalis oulophora]